MRQLLFALAFTVQALVVPTHALIDEQAVSELILSDNNQATTNNKPTDLDDIAIDNKAIADSDIQSRIQAIFAEIEGLDKVVVTVNQGVVKLLGETANDKKAVQAFNLANRLQGVVAVEDEISRTLSVEDNVTPVVNELMSKVKSWTKALPLLLTALLAFLVVASVGKFLSNRTQFWQKVTPNPFVAELLSGTVKFVFIVLGLILGLSLMGAQGVIGTLLGGAGILGIAVGFAVKDSIENYIASIMLSLRQPFRATDRVIINDKEGIVVRLTSRATILMTLDGNHLRIPNSEVFKGTILNYTKNPERRFRFELGVDANNDPLAAIKVGLDAINSLDFVLDEPKAVAVINEIGDSNIVLEFQVWVNQSQTDFAKARSIAIRQTKHALENTGFSLPEPIYKLNFDQALEDAIVNLANKFGQNQVRPIANADDSEKQKAKQRAKQILDNASIDDMLSTDPDPKLRQKVQDEITNKDNDLLNDTSPEE